MSSVRAVLVTLLVAGWLASAAAVAVSPASPVAEAVDERPMTVAEPPGASPRFAIESSVDTGESDEPAVVQVARLSRYPEPGVVRVNLTFRVGADAGALVVYDDDRVSVVDTGGFKERPNGRWKWTETTDRPWLSTRVRVNRTSNHFGGYAWVATASWAMLRPPRSFAYYSKNRSGWINGRVRTPLVDRRVEVTGTGFAGPIVSYLGAHEVFATNDTGPPWFRLVVPNASTVGTPPREVLRMYERARSQLDVGANARTVNVFVAPDPMRQGGLTAGRSGGTYDVWVAENESTGAPANIWLHEYVHVRQNLTLGPRMQWFQEASASYYAGLLSVRQGRSGRAGFERFLDRLHRSKHEDATLSTRSSWPTFLTPYSKGQRVLAALDGRIRNDTGGNRTLMTVFRRMNAHDGTVTYGDFEAIVGNVSGTDHGAWLAEHVDGDGQVDPPRSPFRYVRPDGTGDADGDGLDAARERSLGTHPFAADTDRDGLRDDAELANDTSPTLADTDRDGVDDGTELARGTDPVDPFSTPGVLTARSE